MTSMNLLFDQGDGRREGCVASHRCGIAIFDSLGVCCGSHVPDIAHPRNLDVLVMAFFGGWYTNLCYVQYCGLNPEWCFTNNMNVFRVFWNRCEVKVKSILIQNATYQGTYPII